MNFPFESKQPGPLPWLVVVVCLVYLLAGIIGHDPWKSEDAIGLAVAKGFYAGDNLLKPTLAGEPWTEVEPLWHWVAAAMAGISAFLLPFHDGARLASALFGGLFLVFLAGAARKLHNADAGWGAPLLAIGTLGILVPMHEAQPATAILATIAGTYWGIALLPTRPLAGALFAGASLGAGFLAGGFGGVLPPLTLLIVPLLQKRYAAFAIAATLTVVVAGMWPLALARFEPTHLDAWWAAELATIAPRNGLTLAHAEYLGWFAWPVLYVALWAIWRSRHNLTSPETGLPLLGLIVALGWFVTHEAKMAFALPMIPPLVLLAAAGCARLRRGAANAWDWFGMVIFSFVSLLVWFGASALHLGWPTKMAANAAKLAPGFVAEFSPIAMLLALAATGAWISAIVGMPRSPWRVASRWAVGLTVFWVLVVSLWLPWIDYGKTYRPVVAELRKALPADAGCVGRWMMGAPQRAALDYFAGIRTRWGTKACNWLIVQSGRDETAPEGWSKVWEGHRPGDYGEWLRLYRRAQGAPAASSPTDNQPASTAGR